MSRKITIDPVTRLEGHGRIDIHLDDAGEVEAAFFVVPEFRGFEKFCEGRAAEEMPTLSQKICGVCPMAHHIASSKALDDLFRVAPPPAARRLRELAYNAFMFEDHLLNFFFLGGPDFVMGPDAPAAERNILGVIGKVGAETGRRVIAIRKQARGVVAAITGSPLFPVFGLPGGVSKPLAKEDLPAIQAAARDAVDFARFSLKVFDDVVLKNSAYVDAIVGDVYTHATYYMGLVDEKNRVSFYDGKLRVVTPEGKEFLRFAARDYLEHLAEEPQPWTFAKMLFLKAVGWKGFTDGAGSGIYRVAPLARLNAADGMATPEAQAEYERFFATFKRKPVHHTLAYHWARLIEVMHAAERMVELSRDPEILDPHVRNLPSEKPAEGIGVCEAPRGTLIHHYRTDERGVLTGVNLLVATQNNAAAINLSVTRAARRLIHGGKADDGILNRIEMAFRAYDPCFACTTHSLPGEMPLLVRLLDPAGQVLREIKRDPT